MHVIVVEDEAPVVRLLGWFLKEAGFSVESIDGREDVAARAEASAPAVVVLNARAAADTKRRWIDALRKMPARPKVLDVSTGADMPDASADARVSPPFDADDLVEAVRRLA